MSTCFQAGKRRADQRLARCGSTSTATISDTPLLEYQRAALAYRHRVAQHDALALIARMGIGAIFFLSGRTRVESWLILVFCRWQTGPGTGGRQRGTACCVTRDRPGAGCQAAGSRQQAGSDLICSCFNSCLRPFCLS